MKQSRSPPKNQKLSLPLRNQPQIWEAQLLHLTKNVEENPKAEK